MLIGVLALQGAFIEHQRMLEKLGVQTFTIRNKEDLNKKMDGLVLPGGESTAMYKLLKDLNLEDSIKTLISSGLPVMGTCAGLLLLAKKIKNYDHAFLKVMDITAVKNAYGKQLGSFKTKGEFAGKKDIPFVFIRAPYIEDISKDVEVLAIVDERIVAARQNNILATAFHPELTNDLTIHQYFLNMIKK
ncbi:MAG: pyridoxal 5'-phosphate synthase glutaminase subunit PdxT [Candidatus Izemoplasmatales bacterium]|jgi:5'-phosphate synthase pdxT subunit|nr:pyridoxal 5'-phosphate synthase glutaminase subunit PdxT [Candidatus Izemoplasmatales bacterium]